MHTSACACSSNGDVKECNCAGDSTHGGRHVFTDAIRFFSMTAQRYVEGVVWGIFSFVLLKMIFVANAVRNISSDGNPAGELKSRLRLAARLVPSSLHASGTCNSTVVVNHSSTPSSLERGSHDRSVARSGHGGRRAVPSKFRYAWSCDSFGRTVLLARSGSTGFGGTNDRLLAIVLCLDCSFRRPHLRWTPYTNMHVV